MIEEVLRFERLLTDNFELDDLQATRIVIAATVSHKSRWSEMLWLRIIGASGTGKTEFLRTLVAQEGYCVTMESLTAGAIRRGFVTKKDGEIQPTLLQRLNGKLVITKEFASMLTKDMDSQKEIFGLLRSVYDGELDADYGSEQGHLHQATHFDWILGSTAYIDKVRSIEYLLGSRFVDIHWESPAEREMAVVKAIMNDGDLELIRGKLARAMADIIASAEGVPKPRLDYVPEMANISASLRSPVERNYRTMEIEDLPEVELGTRMGQALSRIAGGLLMIGVQEEGIKPYLNRIILNSMTRIRSAVVRAQMAGLTKQSEIAARLNVSQGTVSRVLEDMKVLGWKDEWLDILNGRDK